MVHQFWCRFLLRWIEKLFCCTNLRRKTFVGLLKCWAEWSLEFVATSGALLQAQTGTVLHNVSEYVIALFEKAWPLFLFITKIVVIFVHKQLINFLCLSTWILRKRSCLFAKTQQTKKAAKHMSLVNLKYEDLVAGADLTNDIATAYGPDGIGVLTVRYDALFCFVNKKIVYCRPPVWREPWWLGTFFFPMLTDTVFFLLKTQCRSAVFQTFWILERTCWLALAVLQLLATTLRKSMSTKSQTSPLAGATVKKSSAARRYATKHKRSLCFFFFF